MRAIAFVLLLSACGTEADVTMFARPLSTRQSTPTQAANQQSIPVGTFDQLVNAVGTAATRGQNQSDAVAGTEIIIVEPIKFRSMITVPPAAAGLTIRSNAAVPITATGELPYVFRIEAPGVRIVGLKVKFQAAGDGFAGFIDAAIANPGGRITVDDNEFQGSATVAGTFFNTTDGFVFNVRLSDNEVQANAAPSTFAVINGTYFSLRDNTINGYATVAVAGAAGGLSSLLGNKCGGGAINMASGIGGNVLAPNVLVGAVTPGPGDSTTGTNT